MGRNIINAVNKAVNNSIPNSEENEMEQFDYANIEGDTQCSSMDFNNKEQEIVAPTVEAPVTTGGTDLASLIAALVAAKATPEQMTAAIEGLNATPVAAAVAATVEPKASNAWDLKDGEAWRTYMILPDKDSVELSELLVAVEAGFTYVIVNKPDGSKKFFGALTVAHTKKQFKEEYEPMGCKLHWITKGTTEEKYNWANNYFNKYWTGTNEIIGMLERVSAVGVSNPERTEDYRNSFEYDADIHEVVQKRRSKAVKSSKEVSKPEFEPKVEVVVEPTVVGSGVDDLKSLASDKPEGYDPFAVKETVVESVEPAPIDETIFESVVELDNKKKYVVLFLDDNGEHVVEIMTEQVIADHSFIHEQVGGFKVMSEGHYRKVSGSPKNVVKLKQRAAKLNARMSK